MNYYFVRTPTRRAGIGISYSNGEDPKAALADQETWQLAFKLQI